MSKPEDVQASFCATLVDEWARLGVRAAMIAPGSRSTPLALALVSHPSIETSIFLDERSAAFAALGWGLVSEAPAIVLCTSGTAATHFHAAVAEADLSMVPLLVVTADRPGELKDVGAAQTIDQTDLFGAKVRWFHEPGVAVEATRRTWRSLAVRAFAASVGVDPGPVHLNLAFREPLLGVARVDDDVVKRSVERGHGVLAREVVEELVENWTGRRGVIVAGRGAARPERLVALSTALGWPLLAEPRSGAQSGSVLHYDSIVRSADAGLRPEVVVRFGEAPSSKVLGRFLADSGATQWHIARGGRPFDPDHLVAGWLRCDPDTLIDAVIDAWPGGAVNGDWALTWRERDVAARAAMSALDDPTAQPTGPNVARHVVSSLPAGSHLVLSSSMPIRDVEWFAGDCSHLIVHSNRGANGIDGVVATAIGVALASGRPTGLLIGDVALIHDASSLAAVARRQIDLRVVVVDNDGGGIFHHLPQASALDPMVFERVFGTPHGADIEAIARGFGIDAVTAPTLGRLRERVANAGPSLTVVRTDRERDLAEHRRLHAAV